MNKRGFIKKILVFILVLTLAMFIIKYFESNILAWLESYPLLWAMFTHMREQVQKKSLLGLAYLTFGANLFFIMFPIEAAAAFYFTLGYPFPLILATLVAASVVGQFFNYLVGLLLGRHVFGLFFRGNMEQMESHSERWGFWMLMLFSVIPFLPLDAISIFLGSMKYKIRHFLMWVTIMTGIKYMIVYFFAEWIQKVLGGYMSFVPYLSNFV